MAYMQDYNMVGLFSNGGGGNVISINQKKFLKIKSKSLLAKPF
jgi:hypothetical protein